MSQAEILASLFDECRDNCAVAQLQETEYWQDIFVFFFFCFLMIAFVQVLSFKMNDMLIVWLEI